MRLAILLTVERVFYSCGSNVTKSLERPLRSKILRFKINAEESASKKKQSEIVNAI